MNTLLGYSRQNTGDTATAALRCLVLNRWNDDFAAYERYIDHSVHPVAYITKRCAESRLPRERAACIETVDDINDRPSVLKAARRCRAALGGIDRLIALSEFDLMPAAELRAEFGVPGPNPDEARRFRDKTVMKAAVAAAGLRVPAFARLDDQRALEELLTEPGFPVMLKPRAGAASQGCYRIDSREAFDQVLPQLKPADYQCERFINGPIFHVDGIVQAGTFLFVKASRYLATCYDFAQGKPLGSVLLEPGRLERALRAFARDCLAALGLTDGAFHLEVIQGQEGFYFLEVGARVGGGEIPFLMRDLYGIDLYDTWIGLQLGRPPRAAAPDPTAPASGGFLLIPEPVGRRVIHIDSPLGKVDGLYAAVVPEVGQVFDGNGGYDVILGRFRYRAASEHAAEQAIGETLARYRVRLEKID